jgi:hypothetical protein
MDWRRLRYEELHDLYSSQIIIRAVTLRRKGWADHVARRAKTRDSYKGFGEEIIGEKPLGRYRRIFSSVFMTERRLLLYGILTTAYGLS